MNALKTLLQRGHIWYASRSPQDQRAVKLLALVLIPFLIYFVLVFPVQRAHASARMAVEAREAELATMQANVARVLASRGGGSGKLDRNGRRLNQLISDTAPQFNLTVSRLQPKGDHELQVWLEEAGADNCILWLHQLETGYGIQVAALNATTGKTSGVIKLQLRLKDGA